MTTTADNTDTCTVTTCTLRSALSAAAETPAADTITVPAGTITLSETGLEVGSDVTIVGVSARATAVVGTGFSPVFRIGAVVTATISHLAMRGGNQTEFDGGGVLNQGGTAVLDHVLIAGNNARRGGGAANINGTMTIQSSRLEDNHADSFGGDGGALFNSGGGSGVPGHLTVRDTTIAFNSAVGTGGISGDANAANTTTLDRVTLYANSSVGTTPVQAGGLFVPLSGGGLVQVHGSIIAGNRNSSDAPFNCGGQPPTSTGGNVETGSDCALNFAGDLQNTDPLISAEPSSDIGETSVNALPANSPAVDRFDCTASDQRDIARPQGGLCDAGAYELLQAPDTTLAGDAPAFTFSSAAPGVTFECMLVSGGSGPNAFTPCASPYSVAGLPPGTYTFSVRAVDPASGGDPSPASRTFTVAAPPAPTPTPAPAPAPTPEAQETVVVKPLTGKVLVRLPGSTKFTEIDVTKEIPVGATFDTKHGVIELSSILKPGGKVQTAKFFDGIFKVTQTGSTTDLTLTEPLAPCPKAKKNGKQASAAAKKPKTRKLWGSGKGTFRTRGQYSSATVRGTKWLVQDSCDGTLTRVTSGVVAVRDNARRKTLLLRAHKRYLAKPPKR